MPNDDICIECARPAACDEDGVCQPCWEGRNRGACAKCWDIVDQPGADLCDWCAMTPEQRRKRQLRMWLIFAAWCAVMALLTFWR